MQQPGKQDLEDMLSRAMVSNVDPHIRPACGRVAYQEQRNSKGDRLAAF